MIDSHAHIDSEEFFGDFDEIMQRAKEAGIEYIIIPAIEPRYFERIKNITKNYKEIYGSMGIHPHNAMDYNEETEKEILFYLKNPKIIAVGEIGLDYYYDFNPKRLQIKVFEKQIDIALESNLPIIIHNREAEEDIYSILKAKQNGNLTGVLHCFSSDEEFMRKAIDLGFHISFTGNITFKKSKLSDVVYEAPLDKILIETDSPFMTPVPLRGKRNEPSYVKLVAEKISEIKKTSIEEVIKMTTQNAKNLFRIASILFLILFSSYSLFSQKNNEEYEFTDESELVHPYKKVIGISPMIGTNTVVETYYFGNNAEKDISRDGLFSYGGSLNYYLFDFLSIEANYMYSKDTKIVEEFKGTILPNIYQIAEITTHWVPNPYNIINYYGTLGGTYFHTKINTDDFSALGLNFGVGFMINLNFDNYGIIALQGEWRLDFNINKVKAPYIEFIDQQPVIKQYDRTVYYSIPRFGIFWYPKF